MLLTRKNAQVSAAGPRLRRLAGVPLPTMDRRTFLKRSGLVAGAGAFASQLPYGAIGIRVELEVVRDAVFVEIRIGRVRRTYVGLLAVEVSPPWRRSNNDQPRGERRSGRAS